MIWWSAWWSRSSALVHGARSNALDGLLAHSVRSSENARCDPQWHTTASCNPSTLQNAYRRAYLQECLLKVLQQKGSLCWWTPNQQDNHNITQIQIQNLCSLHVPTVLSTGALRTMDLWCLYVLLWQTTLCALVTEQRLWQNTYDRSLCSCDRTTLW